MHHQFRPRQSSTAIDSSPSSDARILGTRRRAKVAILLAAYNGMRFLPTQVASVLSQEDVDVTLFVSADLSSDGTYEWLQALAVNEERVRLMPYGERYGAAAANFFRLVRDVDVAAFDFVSFCDQDDLWFPDKLSRAVATLSNSRADGYSSDVLAWFPHGHFRKLSKAGRMRRWDHLFSAPGPGCTQVVSAPLFGAFKRLVEDSRDLVDQIDYHDWLLYAFARQNGYDWFIDPRVSLLYRQHESNQLGANLGFASAVARIRQIRSGWFLEQVSLVATVVGGADELPIRHLAQPGRRGLVAVAALAPRLRRRLPEAAVLGMAVLFARPEPGSGGPKGVPSGDKDGPTPDHEFGHP